MDARTSVKRVRADSTGTALLLPNGNANSAAGSSQPPSVDADTLQLTLDKLSSSWKNGALLQAALKYPDVRQMVFTEMELTNNREKNRTVDFDYCSKSVWKSLNITYAKMSGSRQYDAAFDVKSSIDSIIETIAEQCQRPSSSQTRRNGFKVLRKIAKSILLSGDTLGHEVRKQFGDDSSLEDAMLAILKQMDAGEIADIRRGGVSGSESDELWDKLLELKELANGNCFDKFNSVIEFMEGRAQDYENEEEYMWQPEEEDGEEEEEEEDGEEEEEDEDGEEEEEEDEE